MGSKDAKVREPHAFLVRAGCPVKVDEAVGIVAAQDVREVRDAAKGGGLLVAVVPVRDQITEAAPPTQCWRVPG